MVVRCLGQFAYPVNEGGIIVIILIFVWSFWIGLIGKAQTAMSMRPDFGLYAARTRRRRSRRPGLFSAAALDDQPRRQARGLGAGERELRGTDRDERSLNRRRPPSHQACGVDRNPIILGEGSREVNQLSHRRGVRERDTRL